MKKIDKYIIKGFIGPYLIAFFVAEFVLVMQFLWKYIDDILGKGFSVAILLELIFYFAVTIIPMAIPLTILISSVMVFGNLGERFELSSMKSAGVSLFRIMLGGVLISMLTFIMSLVASNFLKPAANKKFYNRLYSIKRQKANLNLEKGVFNPDFDNYTIRIGDKEKDSDYVKDVIMYDQTDFDKSFISLVTAKEGKMYSAQDGEYFVMELEQGHQYRDVKKTSMNKDKKDQEPKYPFMRTSFSKWTKIFDMDEFEMVSGNNLSRKEFDLLNATQLNSAIDSIEFEMKETNKVGQTDFGKLLANIQNEEEKKKTSLIDGKTKKSKFEQLDKTIQESKKRNLKLEKTGKKVLQFPKAKLENASSLIDMYNYPAVKHIFKTSKSAAKNINERVKTRKTKKQSLKTSQGLYVLRLHQQFSWALICIVFLFIGAPLGSIVKKGGYGYPLLVAIIFFMLFIIFNIMGEKLTKTGDINPVIAAWLPHIVLIPVAIYLTYMAVIDARFTNVVFWFKKLPIIRKFDSA